MTLAIDASVAVWASTRPDGFARLPADLVAPALLWSEATATLHRRMVQGLFSRENAEFALGALLSAPVRHEQGAALLREAWRVADELGWTRTYDAEYVGLARLLGVKLVTLDLKLRRGAARLGLVVTLDELLA